MYEAIFLHVLSAAITGFVAFGEIIARYRAVGLPRVLRSGAVWGYLLVNVGAGVTGPVLMRAFAPGLGPVQAALIGAFGALMLLRASVMSVRSGTIDVPIGPASILSAILSAADRSIDLISAVEVASLARLLESVPFARAAEALPSSLLRTRPLRDGAEARDLLDQVELISASPAPKLTKSVALVGLLCRYFGAEAVRNAIHANAPEASAALDVEMQLERLQSSPLSATNSEFWDPITRKVFERVIEDARIEQGNLLDEFPDRAAAAGAVRKLVGNGLIIRSQSNLPPDRRTLLPTSAGLAAARELQIESPGPLEAIRSLAGG